MSKRQRTLQTIISRINSLSDTEISEVLDFIFDIEDHRQSDSAVESVDDDILLSLLTATENIRARQVFEWESTRRRAEAGSSKISHASR